MAGQWATGLVWAGKVFFISCYLRRHGEYSGVLEVRKDLIARKGLVGSTSRYNFLEVDASLLFVRDCHM